MNKPNQIQIIISQLSTQTNFILRRIQWILKTIINRGTLLQVLISLLDLSHNQSTKIKILLGKKVIIRLLLGRPGGQTGAGDGTKSVENPSITIESGHQEQMKSLTIDPEERSPLIKIERDNKSIFSELTDKNGMGSIVTAQQQPLQPAFIDYPTGGNYSFGIQKYPKQVNRGPSLIDTVPILRRPNHSQLARPQTTNKTRKYTGMLNHQHSLHFPLFSEGTNPGSKLMRGIQILEEKQLTTLSNDQNLAEHMHNFRRKHSASEQRQQIFTRPGTQQNGQGRNMSNKVFLNSQAMESEIGNTLSSTQISSMLRAKSTKSANRPQTTQVKNRKMINNRTTLDIDQTVLRTAEDEYQKSLGNQNLSEIMNNFHFDGEGSINNTISSRPQTAGLILPNQRLGRKNLALVQSLQKAQAITQNSDLDIIHQTEPTIQNNYVNIREALSYLHTQQQPLNDLDLQEVNLETQQHLNTDLQEEFDQSQETIDKVDLQILERLHPRQGLLGDQSQYQVNTDSFYMQTQQDQMYESFQRPKSSIIEKIKNSVRAQSLGPNQTSLLEYQARWTLNRPKIFKRYEAQGQNDDFGLYCDLKELMNKENNSPKEQVRALDLNVIKEKMDKIELAFIQKKQLNDDLKGKTKSLNRVGGMQLVNTNNRMEPMTRGPFFRTKKENRFIKERNSKELSFGYGHTGSPFEHPYLNWMNNLRQKVDKQQDKDQKEVRVTKDEAQYQSYLTEVKALNIVKEFLSENRNTLIPDGDNQMAETQVSTQNDMNSLIPAALPLYNLKTNASMMEPEVKVKDHECLDCYQQLAQFKNIFDTGGILTYLNIKYVNEFMDEEQSKNMGTTSHKPQLIYENYKPKNTVEMREYILYTIDKSLSRYLKSKEFDSLKDVLGSVGQSKNLSTEIKQYKYIKKTREYSVLSYGNNNQSNNQSNGNIQEQTFGSVGPHCLLFDSFFECGNLEKAEYVNKTEYNLYLSVDTNTKGHQQWFYFKVKNTFKDTQYTFNIRNFTKPFSLYKQGMRIMMRSKKQQEKLAQQSSEPISPDDQWEPVGENICYWRTDIQRSGWRVPGPINMDDEEDDDQFLDDINGVDGGAGLISENKEKKSPNKKVSYMSVGNPLKQQNQKRRRRYFYTLTFKVKFEYDDDVVYFAYSTPYPYSQIFTRMLEQEQKLIDKAIDDDKDQIHNKITLSPNKLERLIQTRDLIYDRKLLCRTISGLPLPVITLTASKTRGIEYRKRQVICLSARVHPGETNSNFVFDGFLEYLLSQAGIDQLLSCYIFKLIPCLNPDGNVCGNYRSSLAGVDLNRQWILPNKELHPSVFHSKEMISSVSKERQLLMYCDLHCHSKKKNSFIYGCNTAANGGFTSWTKVRLLPRILARQTHLFNLKDCRFKVDPSKLGTARVIIWKEFGVTNSFTLENSFYAYNYGKEVVKFTPRDYFDIGQNLCQSLIHYRACLKQIERELVLTKGWLKPKLLLQVTGTPAAEKIALEINQQIKDQKRKKKIEEYRQQLGLSQEQDPISINDTIKSTTAQDDKTRNIQRAKTEIQSNILPDITKNKSEQYKKQISNITETPKKVRDQGRKESSCDSTKIDSSNQLAIGLNQITEMSEQIKLKNNTPNSINEPEKKGFMRKYIRKYLKVKTDHNPQNHYQDPNKNSLQLLPDIRVRNSSLTGNSTKSNKAIKTPNTLNKGNTVKIEESEGSSSNQNTIAADWREFFVDSELNQAYDRIQNGIDPVEEEEEDSEGSEEGASEDDLDKSELYKEVYQREHLYEKEMSQLKNAEMMILQDFQLQQQKFSQEVRPFTLPTQDSPLKASPIQLKPLQEYPPLDRNGSKESTSRVQQQSKLQAYQNNPRTTNTSKNATIAEKKSSSLVQREQILSINDQLNPSHFRRPSSQIGAATNLHNELNLKAQINRESNLSHQKEPKDQSINYYTSMVQKNQAQAGNQSLKKQPQQSSLNQQLSNINQRMKIQSTYLHQGGYNQSSKRKLTNNSFVNDSNSFTEELTATTPEQKGKSGFSQYVLKNLRYEGLKVQQAYQRIKNSSNVNRDQSFINQSKEDLTTGYPQNLSSSFIQPRPRVGQLKHSQLSIPIIVNNRQQILTEDAYTTPAIVGGNVSFGMLHQEIKIVDQHKSKGQVIQLPNLKTSNNARQQVLQFNTNTEKGRLNGFDGETLRHRRISIQRQVGKLSQSKIDRIESNSFIQIH